MDSTRRTNCSVFMAIAAVLGLAACGGSAKSGYSPAAPGEAAEAAAPADAQGYGAPQAAAPSPGRAEAESSGAPAAPAGEMARGGAADSVAKSAPAPETRPGLGTEWGESRYSRVSTQTFVRAEAQNPFAMTSIYYNDRAGIDSMIRSWGGSPVNVSAFPVWQGYLDVALRGEGGETLTGLTAGGRNYVTGQAGQRYTILVRNNSPGRVEVVASVDGLDVIDGRPAAYSKRGYLLGGHESVEIEGFRTSETQVAAFRFGAVSQSYAERKTGDARNVGVIGVAFFHEQGDSPQYWLEPWRYQDAQRRNQANPFPQQYATPPR